MNVSLTPELEKLVNEKVKSGMYKSASEVMREALRALQRDELRREILLGVEQIRNGQYTTLNGPQELEAFFEDIKKRGLERLAKKK